MVHLNILLQSGHLQMSPSCHLWLKAVSQSVTCMWGFIPGSHLFSIILIHGICSRSQKVFNDPASLGSCQQSTVNLCWRPHHTPESLETWMMKFPGGEMRQADAMQVSPGTQLTPQKTSETYEHWSPAAGDVEELRQKTKWAVGDKDRANRVAQRSPYPEVAQPGATPTPHPEKRTAPGKINCFLMLFFLLLSVSLAKAPPMTSAHLSSFSSSSRAGVAQDSDRRGLSPPSKLSTAKQGES